MTFLKYLEIKYRLINKNIPRIKCSTTDITIFIITGAILQFIYE
jgi:hypothetical protein